jgi:hypothetical protein
MNGNGSALEKPQCHADQAAARAAASVPSSASAIPPGRFGSKPWLALGWAPLLRE